MKTPFIKGAWGILYLLARAKNNLFPVRKPKVSASGVSGWKLIRILDRKGE
jgi:hypothetical protein